MQGFTPQSNENNMRSVSSPHVLGVLEQPNKHDPDGADDDSNYSIANQSRSTTDYSSFQTLEEGRTAEERKIIEKRSGREAVCLKGLVLFLLFGAACLVVTVVYLTTTEGERQAFERDFSNSADKFFEMFKTNLERKLAALDNFGIEVTSIAVHGNMPFPNVTIPDLAHRAKYAMAIAKANSMTMTPVVTAETRPGWEAYSSANGQWMNDTIEFQTQRSLQQAQGALPAFRNGFANEVFTTDQAGLPYVREDVPLYYPVWQHFPVIPQLVNFDLLSSPDFRDDYQAITASKSAVMGQVWDLGNTDSGFAQNLKPMFESLGVDTTAPVSKIFYPIFDKIGSGDREMVAVVSFVGNTYTFFLNALSNEKGSMYVILRNECNQEFTWTVGRGKTTYAGSGNLHDSRFTEMGKVRSFQEIFNEKEQILQRYSDISLDSDYCPYTVTVYPSYEMEIAFITDNALYNAIGVGAIFAFTIAMFLTYDLIVKKRQTRMMKQAVQSRLIVSSLFPEAVRDRLFRAQSHHMHRQEATKFTFGKRKGSRLKTYLQTGEDKTKDWKEKPIADLFAQTTVMFADISGFTEWSSARDPSQVFLLLQTVYREFDKIAKKRNVFKVETIGDCYIAVTGLPDPQEDHAQRMIKFADSCRLRFINVVGQLKTTFGPETANLAMRFGLHSGPVTAGVLQGEKSRFQLFGNTVNIAAKMESSGEANKIQISSETADIVRAVGKGHWIIPRIDDAGDRGGIQTFWVDPKSILAANSNSDCVSCIRPISDPLLKRLVKWNTERFKTLLKRMVAYRIDMGLERETLQNILDTCGLEIATREEPSHSIELPSCDPAKCITDPASIQLGDDVERQLETLVKRIASLYTDDPVHSFKHASDVCTHAQKLLYSIADQQIASRTSDPFTTFAVVLGALVHDMGHAGIASHIQISEKRRAVVLRDDGNPSTQQGSIHMALNLLMDPEFTELQEVLFHTREEFGRFRKLVVNSVMATDVLDMDPTVDHHSDDRWKNGFGGEEDSSSSQRGNLQATLAIEAAMQLADRMHMVQHFQSFCRWNERALEQESKAFLRGRSSHDPSLDWYSNELRTFDQFVIPLVQRLHDHAVFGVASQIALRNAVANRKRWSIVGVQLVETFTWRAQQRLTLEQQAA